MKRNIMISLSLLLLPNALYAVPLMSQEEAEETLRNTLNKTPACIVLDVFEQFPVTIDPDSISDRNNRSILKALTNAGVLKVEKEAVKMEKNMGFMRQTVTVSAELFTLSEHGKKYFREDAIQISRGRHEPKHGPGLCYSNKLEVTGITRFVGPTVINYYLQAVEKAAWAEHEDVVRTGLIVDKSWGNFKTLTLKGQPAPPPGIEAQALFHKQKDGTYRLTNY